jgi:hypothetical protein
VNDATGTSHAAGNSVPNLPTGRGQERPWAQTPPVWVQGPLVSELRPMSWKRSAKPPHSRVVA